MKKKIYLKLTFFKLNQFFFVFFNFFKHHPAAIYRMNNKIKITYSKSNNNNKIYKEIKEKKIEIELRCNFIPYH